MLIYKYTQNKKLPLQKSKTMFKKGILCFFVLLLLSACASKKDYVYVQDIDKTEFKSEKFTTVLQPDDLISIVVFGENSAVVAPYNSPNSVSASVPENGMPIQLQPQTYLIASDNTINLLVIGKVKIGGLTKAAAEAEIISKLSQFLVNPSIDLRILNYKIAVQGEVNRPGSFPIASERVTVFEALSMAGDLTIFGKRNNILIIREQDGKKIVERIDITKSEFINSPFYYLHQNDVVYVEPNKTKINTSAVGPNTGIILSGISLLVTILALTIR